MRPAAPSISNPRPEPTARSPPTCGTHGAAGSARTRRGTFISIWAITIAGIPAAGETYGADRSVSVRRRSGPNHASPVSRISLAIEKIAVDFRRALSRKGLRRLFQRGISFRFRTFPHEPPSDFIGDRRTVQVDSADRCSATVCANSFGVESFDALSEMHEFPTKRRHDCCCVHKNDKQYAKVRLKIVLSEKGESRAYDLN